jgi:hypothetical protein
VVTNCEFSIAVKSDADREVLRDLARRIQATARPAPAARFWRGRPDSRSLPDGTTLAAASRLAKADRAGHDGRGNGLQLRERTI